MNYPTTNHEKIWTYWQIIFDETIIIIDIFVCESIEGYRYR